MYHVDFFIDLWLYFAGVSSYSEHKWTCLHVVILTWSLSQLLTLVEMYVPSQLWSVRRNRQSLSKQMTEFSTLRRDPWRWSPREQEGNPGWGAVPSTERQLPGWTWGSPRCSDSWCSVLENKTGENFPCSVSYCRFTLSIRCLLVIPLQHVVVAVRRFAQSAGRLMPLELDIPGSGFGEEHPLQRRTPNPLSLTQHIGLNKEEITDTDIRSWKLWLNVTRIYLESMCHKWQSKDKLLVDPFPTLPRGGPSLCGKVSCREFNGSDNSHL